MADLVRIGRAKLVGRDPCLLCGQALSTPAFDITQSCWMLHTLPPCEWCGTELTKEEFAHRASVLKFDMETVLTHNVGIRRCEKCRAIGRR